MPGFDGTGPRGQGAMTGGGRGYCAVSLDGTDLRQDRGYGFYGMGNNGRGRRNCFYATGLSCRMRAGKGIQAFAGFGSTASNIDELKMLKNQADYLNGELSVIQARVQELEEKKDK